MLLVEYIDLDCLCWPKIETIASRLGVSDKNARHALTEAADIGAISFPEGRSGGRRSSLIRLDLALPNPVEIDPVRAALIPVDFDRPGGTKSTAQPGRDRPPNRRKENAKAGEPSAGGVNEREVDEVVAPLVAGGARPLTPAQRRLVAEGLRENLPAVKDCAFRARNGRSPVGLFVSNLEAARAAGWDVPGAPKSDIAVAAQSWYANIGCDLPESAFHEELDGWRHRGLSEERAAELLERRAQEAPRAA